MVKADMYLLPGLKRFCAAFIAELMDEDNIFTILRLTRLFDLPKLEDTCAEFIANNIEAVSCIMIKVYKMSSTAKIKRYMLNAFFPSTYYRNLCVLIRMVHSIHIC